MPERAEEAHADPSDSFYCNDDSIQVLPEDSRAS